MSREACDEPKEEVHLRVESHGDKAKVSSKRMASKLARALKSQKVATPGVAGEAHPQHQAKTTAQLSQ